MRLGTYGGDERQVATAYTVVNVIQATNRVVSSEVVMLAMLTACDVRVAVNCICRVVHVCVAWTSPPGVASR